MTDNPTKSAAETITVFGFTIPLAADGRRNWTKDFKKHVCAKLESGELSVTDVVETCHVGNSTVHRWRKRSDAQSSKRTRIVKSAPKSSSFAEIKVAGDAMAPGDAQILLKGTGCELHLPQTYPLTNLVTLIQAFETRS